MHRHLRTCLSRLEYRRMAGDSLYSTVSIANASRTKIVSHISVMASRFAGICCIIRGLSALQHQRIITYSLEGVGEPTVRVGPVQEEWDRDFVNVRAIFC